MRNRRWDVPGGSVPGGRRISAAAVLALGGWFAAAGGCATGSGAAADGRGAAGEAGAGPGRPARINHLAFFKLTDPGDRDALVRDCDELLASIPGVVSYYAGPPLDIGRDRVDGDYDVGFYVGFETVEAYEGYVVHPNHLEVVERWGPRLEWLRVHDVLDETP